MREGFCAFAAGILSVFIAAGQLEILVHFFRSIYGINMGIPVLTILGFFGLLFFINDRHNFIQHARCRGGL